MTNQQIDEQGEVELDKKQQYSKQQMMMPIEHRQNRDYLAYHRDGILEGCEQNSKY